MDFWSTVAGNRLACILESTLPDIARKLEKINDKTQYTVSCKDFDTAAQVIEDSISNGHEFVNMIERKDNSILLIMKK